MQRKYKKTSFFTNNSRLKGEDLFNPEGVKSFKRYYICKSVFLHYLLS